MSFLMFRLVGRLFFIAFFALNAFNLLQTAPQAGDQLKDSVKAFNRSANHFLERLHLPHLFTHKYLPDLTSIVKLLAFAQILFAILAIFFPKALILPAAFYLFREVFKHNFFFQNFRKNLYQKNFALLEPVFLALAVFAGAMMVLLFHKGKRDMFLANGMKVVPGKLYRAGQAAASVLSEKEKSLKGSFASNAEKPVERST